MLSFSMMPEIIEPHLIAQKQHQLDEEQFEEHHKARKVICVRDQDVLPQRMGKVEDKSRFVVQSKVLTETVSLEWLLSVHLSMQYYLVGSEVTGRIRMIH